MFNSTAAIIASTALLGILALNPTVVQTATQLTRNIGQADVKKIDTADVERFLEEHQNSGIETRTLAAAKWLLELPFEWGPTGEGSAELGEDKPLFRFDVFDCVTYVETVLALGRAQNFKEFTETLNQLRYHGGLISILYRKHFPSHDWIRGNVLAGYLKNSTATVAQAAGLGLQVAKTIIDKRSWFALQHPNFLKAFDLEFPNYSPDQARIDYIDFDEMWPESAATPYEQVQFQNDERNLYNLMMAEMDNDKRRALQAELNTLRLEHRLSGINDLSPDFVAAMPNISVVSLVRPSHAVRDENGNIVTNMLVTHQGLVIKEGNSLRFLHASWAARNLKVVEIDFAEYFSNFLTSGTNTDDPENRRSTWKGLNVLEIAQ